MTPEHGIGGRDVPTAHEASTALGQGASKTAGARGRESTGLSGTPRRRGEGASGQAVTEDNTASEKEEIRAGAYAPASGGGDAGAPWYTGGASVTEVARAAAEIKAARRGARARKAEQEALAHGALDALFRARLDPRAHSYPLHALRKVLKQQQDTIMTLQKAEPRKPDTHDLRSMMAACPAPREPRPAPGEAYRLSEVVAAEHLPRLDPQVLYTLHQRFCTACQGGEDCYIHTICRFLADGVRIPWADGPPAQRIDNPPIEVGDPARQAFMDEEIGTLIRLGVLKEVSPGDLRVTVPMFAVTCTGALRPRTPEEARVIAEGSMADLDRLASATAVDIARAVKRRVGTGSGALSARARAFDAEWAERVAPPPGADGRPGRPKMRPVTALDQGVNGLTADWPFAYVNLDYLMMGWEPHHVWGTADMEKGFYGVAIHPEDRKYFGVVVRVAGQLRYYQMCRLPMGWKLAPAYYSAATAAVREVMEHLALAAGAGDALPSLTQLPAQLNHVLVRVLFYVDDLIVRMHRDLAAQVRRGVLRLLAALKLRPNQKGTLLQDRVGESTEALGLELHSGQMTVCVKRAKTYTALTLRALAGTGGVVMPAARYESMVGRLGWLAQNCYGGRLCMKGLYALNMRGPSWGWVEPSFGGDAGGAATTAHRSFRESMIAWDELLRSGRVRGYRRVHVDAIATCVHLRSDASGDTAWGAFNPEAREILYHKLRGEEKGWSIDALELCPILAMCERYGSGWAGRLVVFGTDNAGNAYSLNTGKAKGQVTRDILRRVYRLADEHGFDFLALWVPRERNTLCDTISKFNSLTDARRYAEGQGLACAGVAGPFVREGVRETDAGAAGAGSSA